MCTQKRKKYNVQSLPKDNLNKDNSSTKINREHKTEHIQEGWVTSRVVPVPDKPSSSSLRHSSSSSSSVIFDAWRPLQYKYMSSSYCACLLNQIIPPNSKVLVSSQVTSKIPFVSILMATCLLHLRGILFPKNFRSFFVKQKATTA